MKIALLCHSFPPSIGGGESHIYTIAKITGQLGHNVTLITGQNESNKKRPKLKNVKIYEVSGIKDASLGLSGFREASSRIFNILDHIKPDVIHVHNFGPFLLLSYLSNALNAKVIFTYHSTPVPKEKKIIGYFDDYKMEKAFARFIFSQSTYDQLVCPSKYYFNWAKKLGAPQEKMKLVYHGVDTEMFHPPSQRLNYEKLKANYGYRESDFIICSPMRLIERKGILDLLNALYKLKNKKFKLLIPTSLKVANPNFKEKVLDLVKKLNLVSQVQFIWDKIEYFDMPAIYSLSDLVILPSHVEGLGLVILEAMACGKPVIGTKTSGIKEVIVNNINGMLVEPRNPDQLAKAILRMHGSIDLRDKIIKNGFKTIHRKFNAERQINELIQIYEDS